MKNATNAEDVHCFVDDACDGCDKDKNEDCPIIAAAFSEWPVEWVSGKCAAHSVTGWTLPDPNTMVRPLYGGR
jgi:hypothetical protein